MDKTVSAIRTIRWKINNFTLNSVKVEKNFYSNDFIIFLDNRETKWYLELKIAESEFGIFLLMRQSEIEDFMVHCDFFLHKVNGYNVGHHQFDRASKEFMNAGYGFPKFKPFTEIFNSDQYLVNNSITLEIKIKLTKEIKTLNPVPNIYLAINKEYFASKAYSDFTFICSDNAEIPIHRYILAGFSPVLKTLFDIKTEDVQNKIVVDDIDGPTMTEILRFAYTQEVQNVKDLAPKLLHGAHKYEMKDLMKLSAAQMIENLTLENAVEYFLLAEKYELKALLARSATLIKLHPKVLDNNWNRFDKNQVIKLSECFRQCYETIQVFETTL